MWKKLCVTNEIYFLAKFYFTPFPREFRTITWQPRLASGYIILDNPLSRTHPTHPIFKDLNVKILIIQTSKILMSRGTINYLHLLRNSN